MKLPKDVPRQKFDIWNPRWHDRKVLLAKYKAGNHNVITFSKAKSLPGEYYISGEKLRTYPLNTNGKVDCYVVPIDDLELLEAE